MSEAKPSPQLPSAGPALVGLWGVVGDGRTDDTVNLNRASAYAASHSGLDLIVPTLCRTTATWVVPGGAMISGPGGVIADPGVQTAVVVGEPSDFKRAFVRRLTVARSGASPSGSVGLAFVGGADVVLEDPVLYNHDVPLRFSGTNTPGAGGFGAQIRGGVIGGFRSYAIEVDGWPILRFAGTYFGSGTCLQGTSTDFDAKSICHVTGGNPSPGGGGPNSILFDGCKAVTFNKADGTQAVVDSLWDFSGLAADPNAEEAETGFYIWTNGYCEEVRALARADTTAAVIDGLQHLNSTWIAYYGDEGVTWFGDGFAAGEVRRFRVVNVNHYSWNPPPAKLIDLNGPLLSDFVVDTINTYQQPAQGSPSSVAIVAPVGSYGRIRYTDMPPDQISVTGPGAAGIVVG